MAAGDISKTGQLEHECLASCLYSSYAYFALNNGDIWRYTLSGGVNARLGSFPYEARKGLCIATDNTNLFWGGSDGIIYKTVIGSGATTVLANIGHRISSLCYSTNVLYATAVDGGIYTVATA